jgi:hypothetical protein
VNPPSEPGRERSSNVTITDLTPTPAEPPSGRRRASLTTVATTVALAVAAVVLATCDGDSTEPATDQPQPATDAAQDTAADPAVDVAQGFVDAYGAFDTERAMTYLADAADVRGLVRAYNEELEGTMDQLPLVLAWLEAIGHEQMLDSCAEQSSSAAGLVLRCTYDFHSFGSDERGLGPYHGSFFDLTVRDGEIVRAAGNVEISEFSPQMWEPFFYWMDANHPDDAEVMYIPSGNGARFTEESIRLWEQHIREYVAAETAEG